MVHSLKLRRDSFVRNVLCFLIVLFAISPVHKVVAAATIVNLSSAIVSEVASAAPEYIAADAAGNVYISGNGTNEIKKFTAQGDLLLTFGQTGSGDGEFQSPAGIAVDSSGNIFVADRTLTRVQKFDSAGNFVTKWGSAGSGDGQFADSGSMGGIAIDASGNVYVVDSYNDRVQKFDNNGAFITKWGSNGSGNDNFFFFSPSDIAIDGTGNVFIADSGNNRIKKYTQDGVFVSAFGSAGSGNGQFATPIGLSVDPDDNIYVADYDNSRIQVFDASLNFLEAWGSYGTNPGEFENTTDVLYGPVNNLVYVLDYSVKIQFFNLGSYGVTPTPTPTTAPTVTPTPSSTTSTSNSNQSSTASTECSVAPPQKAPEIFSAVRQIGNGSDSITLSFTPVNDRTNGYTILYGTKLGSDEFSASFAQGYSSGAVSYTIGELKQNQSYSFKMQAYNDCAMGPWSSYSTVTSSGETTTTVILPSSASSPSAEQQKVTEMLISDQDVAAEAAKNTEVPVKKPSIDGAKKPKNQTPPMTLFGYFGIAAVSSVGGFYGLRMLFKKFS